MSDNEIKEKYLADEEFEEDFDEAEGEEEDFDLTTEEVLEELKDEISLQSELLERLVDSQEARLEQDKNFQNQLIAVLEKIANK
ncbi:MAG: hypothetical protein SFU25_09400 [Candidatus Caenarcaniphilales bacterium]|nr:hypothetical protein [Candidatus Caenarcaniphilales bacterium]